MRDNLELKELRPEVFCEKSLNSSVIENFQNESLRPILKYQHELFIEFVKSKKELGILLKKDISIIKRRSNLKNFFVKQPSIKYFLIGNITGLFTKQEFDFYLQNKTELDKRIYSLLTERILSI
jgi:hypothetical protein